jgi:hypothetical protein
MFTNLGKTWGEGMGKGLTFTAFTLLGLLAITASSVAMIFVSPLAAAVCFVLGLIALVTVGLGNGRNFQGGALPVCLLEHGSGRLLAGVGAVGFRGEEEGAVRLLESAVPSGAKARQLEDLDGAAKAAPLQIAFSEHLRRHTEINPQQAIR